MDVVYEDFEVLDHSVPYKSGFLGFREVPAYATLISRLRGRAQPPPCTSSRSPRPSRASSATAGGVEAAALPPWPQVFLVDGYGALHHRRCGSASHLGVCCGVPTVGVAKTLLQLEGLHERAARAALSAALDTRMPAATCGGGAAVPAPSSPAAAGTGGGEAPSAAAPRGAGGDSASPECSASATATHDACGPCVVVPSARGEVVQRLDLVSRTTGEVLGVAVAGMHGARRPIYVSTGVPRRLRDGGASMPGRGFVPASASSIILPCCAQLWYFWHWDLGRVGSA